MTTHENIEVELKIPVEESIFVKLRKKLESTATRISKLRELDEYFTPQHRDFLKPEYPFEWLRIREKAGGASLNYKHFYPPNSNATTHCDEFETKVCDASQLRRILAALDLRRLVVVQKDREVFDYESEFWVCLDKVKGLGYFVEIEARRFEGGVAGIHRRLKEVALALGLDVSKADRKGYPKLLLEKQGLR